MPDKKALMGQHVSCICGLCPRLELKKVQAAVSKHLQILPKIQEGGNSARIKVKTASSATIIIFLIYSVMWCGGSVKCDGL